MNNFSIPIPNEKAPAYRLVAFIILALNFFAFGFVFMHFSAGITSACALIGMAATAVPAIFFLLNQRKLKTPLTEICFFISALTWLFWGNYLLAVMMVIFSLLSFSANREMLIAFSSEGIRYPSFPQKSYSWQEVAQVIWKDDILTIDLKNNKLLQFKIDPMFASAFDYSAFNAWCARSAREANL